MTIDLEWGLRVILSLVAGYAILLAVCAVGGVLLGLPFRVRRSPVPTVLVLGALVLLAIAIFG
jgi:hypothetical protein